MIQYNNFSTQASNGFAAGATYTWQHETTGDKRLLVVSVMLWQDVAGTGSISAMTYGGVAMTQAAATRGGAMRTEIWYLVNPAVGVNEISATVSGNTDDRKFTGVSYTGVDQSTPIDATGTSSGGGSPVTLTVTSTKANCWIQSAGIKFSTAVLTPSSGQTVVRTDTSGSTSSATAYITKTTPGAATIDWTTTGTDDWSQVGVAIKPDTTIVAPPSLGTPRKPERVTTTVKILNKSLALVTEVKSLYPLNNQGTILRYSDELSDFGYCAFRVSTKDPMLSIYGDILKPLEYNVHVYRGDTVVWKGIIIDNPERNRNYIEVKAVQYEWFLDKNLIWRDQDNTATDTDESNFKVFNSGTLAANVTNIVNQAVTKFGTNHPLSGLTIGTVENPNYPNGATDQNNAPLTGPWTFTDHFNVQFDYHSAYYVLKQFGIYAGCDFEITSGLVFNWKKFIGNKQTGITFRYGTFGNIVDYNFPRLGGRVVNNMWGIAVDDEGKTYHYLNKDEASNTNYGLLESAQAFADVKSENFLKARVREEMRLIKDPSTNPVSVVLNEKSYPFGVYGVGDIVTVQVKDHVIDFNAPRRIVGITVTVHNTGRELITIQTNQPRDEDLGNV